MCEAAVVSTPLVQNRSLTAIGMPSSGSASPRASRSSAASAIASACSGVVGDVGVERPHLLRPHRYRRRPARAPKMTCGRARRAPRRGSARAAQRRSLDHLRHGEEAACALLRGVAEDRPRGDRRRSPCRRASASRLAATLVIGATPAVSTSFSCSTQVRICDSSAAKRFELGLGKPDAGERGDMRHGGLVQRHDRSAL